MKILSTFLAASLVYLANAEFFMTVLEPSDPESPQEITIVALGQNQNPIDLYFRDDDVPLATCKTTLPVGTSMFSLPIHNSAYSPNKKGRIAIVAVERESCSIQTSAVTIALVPKFQTCQFSTNGNQFGGNVFNVSSTDRFVQLYKTTSLIQTETGRFPLSVIAQMSNVEGTPRITTLTIMYDTKSMILRPGIISAATCPTGLTCDRSTNSLNTQNIRVSLGGYFSIGVTDQGVYLDFDMTIQSKMYPLSSGMCVPNQWDPNFVAPVADQVSLCPAFESVVRCGNSPISIPRTSSLPDP